MLILQICPILVTLQDLQTANILGIGKGNHILCEWRLGSVEKNSEYTKVVEFEEVGAFAALENWEILDLTYCGFNGTFKIEGSERVPIFRKLKTLKLGSNQFNESVLTSLNTFPSLTNLDLSHNPISGPFPAQELSLLTNLEELELSVTHLDDTPNIQEHHIMPKSPPIPQDSSSYIFFFMGKFLSCPSPPLELKWFQWSNTNGR
ncbi:hypothetical protein L2E82_27548 [Cichorium intybus]|uniref:Uncharacterized protein n=1 Tax=Cichorium intybus TaxID=13427 RepID=A0ACB9CTB4_CICIN|nr:hypothetical protein L2E82_27548 [Cichorium intybus]